MKDYSSDPFFNVKFSSHDTSEGPVDLPIRYYDVSNVIAFFLADRAKVEEQLVDTPYNLGITWGKKTLVGLSFYEYRNTDIGSYNEVGVALPVVHKKGKKPFSAMLNNYSRMTKRKIGYYILDLPVSTPIANVAGRELWGYPKFVTELPFNLNGRTFSASVADPNGKEPILSISGKIGFGFKIPPLSLLLYSSVNDSEIKADVNVRGWVKFGSGRKCTLKVGDSEHHMANHLRNLGLNSKSPLLMMYTNNFQSLLNGGRAIV